MPRTCTRVFEWSLLVGIWDGAGDGSTSNLMHFVSFLLKVVIAPVYSVICSKLHLLPLMQIMGPGHHLCGLGSEFMQRTSEFFVLHHFFQAKVYYVEELDKHWLNCFCHQCKEYQ